MFGGTRQHLLQLLVFRDPGDESRHGGAIMTVALLRRVARVVPVIICCNAILPGYWSDFGVSNVVGNEWPFTIEFLCLAVVHAVLVVMAVAEAVLVVIAVLVEVVVIGVVVVAMMVVVVAVVVVAVVMVATATDAVRVIVIVSAV